jgi:uncharacterized membrane-anchored protein YitT (DUF2179 family)
MENIIVEAEPESIKRINSIKSVLINIGLIASGCFVFAIGMNSVMITHQLYCGGLTGIAILIKYQITSLDIGLIYFLLNIPLLVFGWYSISHRFMFYTLFGIIFFSLIADIVHFPSPPVNDMLLAALLSGVICGAGSGLILRSLGSAGGLDILAIYLNKRFSFRTGTVLFIFNSFIILAGVWLLDVEKALYSVIYMFICGRVINLVIKGFSDRKSIMIISDLAEDIATEVLKLNGHGVTFLEGEGAYSHQKKKVVLTIINLTDLPKVKELVLRCDPLAFVVIHDAVEVLGARYGIPRSY